jgi:hypothetical protein
MFVQCVHTDGLINPPGLDSFPVGCLKVINAFRPYDNVHFFIAMVKKFQMLSVIINLNVYLFQRLNSPQGFPKTLKMYILMYI